MPPLRSSNAQGRQKSCTECVKAKRRCDIRQPCCARCNRQSLQCFYPGVSKQTAGPSDVASSQSGVDIVTTSTALDDDLVTSAFDHEEINFGLDEQILDFETGFDITPDNLLHQLSGVFPSHESALTARRPQSPMKLSIFQWTHIAPSSRARVGYAIEQLKLAPLTMVASNSTLWCHARFYDEDMPRPMQAAYATCALYNARNDANAEFVIRHITSQVDELVATSLPTAPAGVIARAHALILYQVMLLFCDNIRCFSVAEAVVDHLDEVGYALLGLSSEQTDCLDSLPLYPSATAHTAWKSYIYRETLRRTVLSLYQLVTLSRMLLGRPNKCAPSLSRGNYVTLSAHLWQAKSAFDFAMAWNEKQHFLVYELDFTHFLTHGQPEDLDGFAKTMLVGLHGIDDIKGWLYERGGAL